MELILILRNLYWYYGTYTGLTDLVLVLRNLYRSYGAYTGITELILVLLILYWYYGTYTGITELILVLLILYWYYGTYTGITELILILRNLFLCEGRRRYDKSELIIIVSHTRSDWTYADTYHIWTLVRSRYGSQQRHIPDSYRFRTYPKQMDLSVYIIAIFKVTLVRRYPYVSQKLRNVY